MVQNVGLLVRCGRLGDRTAGGEQVDKRERGGVGSGPADAGTHLHERLLCCFSPRRYAQGLRLNTVMGSAPGTSSYDQRSREQTHGLWPVLLWRRCPMAIDILVRFRARSWHAECRYPRICPQDCVNSKQREQKMGVHVLGHPPEDVMPHNTG
jgi:hypothetical protein